MALDGFFSTADFSVRFGLFEAVGLALEEREVDVGTRQLRVTGRQLLEFELRFGGIALAHETHRTLEIGERAFWDFHRRGRNGRTTRRATCRAGSDTFGSVARATRAGRSAGASAASTTLSIGGIAL